MLLPWNNSRRAHGSWESMASVETLVSLNSLMVDLLKIASSRMRRVKKYDLRQRNSWSRSKSHRAWRLYTIFRKKVFRRLHTLISRPLSMFMLHWLDSTNSTTSIDVVSSHGMQRRTKHVHLRLEIIPGSSDHLGSTPIKAKRRRSTSTPWVTFYTES
jgi:hypothetical protein